MSKCTSVYLMLNTRNGYIKIGNSTHPKFREATLQSQEPEVDLLCYTDDLENGEDIERQLQRMYRSKKVRGEWFDLTYKDVIDIKQLLLSYSTLTNTELKKSYSIYDDLYNHKEQLETDISILQNDCDELLNEYSYWTLMGDRYKISLDDICSESYWSNFCNYIQKELEEYCAVRDIKRSHDTPINDLNSLLHQHMIHSLLPTLETQLEEGCNLLTANILYSYTDLINDLPELKDVILSLCKKGSIIALQKSLEGEGIDKRIEAIKVAYRDHERNRMKERQAVGIKKAQESGAYKNVGRKATVDKDLIRRLHSEGMNKAGIARHLNISRMTVYRVLAS